MKKDKQFQYHKSYAVVVGTRAELLKMIPILRLLDSNNARYKFWATGQHNLDEIVSRFQLRKPQYFMIPPKKTSHFMTNVKSAIKWWLMLLHRLSGYNTLSNFVLVHGDTMSTAAVSLALSRFVRRKRDFKLVHIESGYRSGDLFEPFPEELCRRLADKFCDILVAPTMQAESNLTSSRFYNESSVFLTGNTITDQVMSYDVEMGSEDYTLFVIHRFENLRSKKRLARIISVAASVDGQVIWPMHDNTWERILKHGLQLPKNVKKVRLLVHPEFIKLLAKSKMVYTDGGSIVEECTYLGKQVVQLRKKTERTERFYGDGYAAHRIMRILENYNE